MKPFDDHVNDLVEQIPGQILKVDVPMFKLRIERALKALARDQRHACAEAVMAIDRNAWSKDAAHQAVINAEF